MRPTRHNPKNERIKHRYLAYLAEARRMAPSSVNVAAAAIALFEKSTGYRDFAAFRIEDVKRFKRECTGVEGVATGRPLAKATAYSRLMALKTFFFWLAGQPGYKSRISYSDADYFNPSANDSRIATARRERSAPEIEQIRHVLGTLPDGTAIEKRDRAIIAFTLLTGARDDAIASLHVDHVDLKRRTVFQDARTVRTKNRKTFTSAFFPVGADVETIVLDWVQYLKAEELFGSSDPLFPATRVEVGPEGGFHAAGLSRRHWKDAGAIRKIFRRSFEAAGLPYFHPHSLRHTLTRLGERICRTPEEFKAWSQNLGHEHVSTTLTSYGAVASHRQTEIIAGLRDRISAASPEGEPDAETIRRVVDHLSRKASRG